MIAGRVVPLVFVALAMVACVEVDPNTGKTKPRGNQKFEYDVVTEHAKQLHKGMTKLECLLLLGSAAEESKDGDTWVYLPERPAVLVPSSALELQFGPDTTLEDWGYHPIVLGLRL
jgi:hypothetical protein